MMTYGTLKTKTIDVSFAFLFIQKIKMFYLFQNIKHRSLSLEKLKPSISRKPNFI